VSTRDDMPSGGRVDWSRVRNALQYAEAALGARFHGSGGLRSPDHRGWLRNRLREVLEAFPSADAAQRWVESAVFKARGKASPMAYFAELVCRAARDSALLDPSRLLSQDELRAWQSVRPPQGPAGSGKRAGGA
jgi:hypothetical protein